MRAPLPLYGAILLALSCRPVVAADAPAPATDWRQQFDLDGDGVRDEIRPNFTGGAHCCYRIEVALSSSPTTVAVPFDIDGGYVGGLDRSRPGQFDVRRTPRGAEIEMQIATVNGRALPIPEEWTRAYGIRTHHVAVSFAGGKMRVRDLP